MKIFISLVLTLIMVTSNFAQTNSFKVRYMGGTIESKVKKDDWGNRLVVASDQITIDLKDGQKIQIDPQKVTRISYSRNARRLVGTMVALAVLASPVALFGLFYKKKSHFVGIEFKDANDKNNGILLQSDKGEYRALLVALKGATGKEVDNVDEEKKKKKD
jgi:hypothetical protein